MTGGASGTGKATAKATATALIAAGGGSVVIADIQDEAGSTATAENEASGASAACGHLDVTDEQSWTDAVTSTVDRFGGLDILVSNVGIGPIEPLGVTTIDAWNKVVAVTQTSGWRAMRRASSPAPSSCSTAGGPPADPGRAVRQGSTLRVDRMALRTRVRTTSIETADAGVEVDR